MDSLSISIIVICSIFIVGCVTCFIHSAHKHAVYIHHLNILLDQSRLLNESLQDLSQQIAEDEWEDVAQAMADEMNKSFHERRSL